MPVLGFGVLIRLPHVQMTLDLDLVREPAGLLSLGATQNEQNRLRTVFKLL
jgi:hypothetical protein